MGIVRDAMCHAAPRVATAAAAAAAAAGPETKASSVGAAVSCPSQAAASDNFPKRRANLNFCLRDPPRLPFVRSYRIVSYRGGVSGRVGLLWRDGRG